MCAATLQVRNVRPRHVGGRVDGSEAGLGVEPPSVQVLVFVASIIFV